MFPKDCSPIPEDNTSDSMKNYENSMGYKVVERFLCRVEFGPCEICRLFAGYLASDARCHAVPWCYGPPPRSSPAHLIDPPMDTPRLTFNRLTLSGTPPTCPNSPSSLLEGPIPHPEDLSTSGEATQENNKIQDKRCLDTSVVFFPGKGFQGPAGEGPSSPEASPPTARPCDGQLHLSSGCLRLGPESVARASARVDVLGSHRYVVSTADHD